MNKDSPKDFKELNPDDVIYIDEDQRPKPPEPAARPEPQPPSKPAVADLPLAEDRQAPLKEGEASASPKPRPPVFDIPILEQPEPSPTLESEDLPPEDLPEPAPTAVEMPAASEPFSPAKPRISPPAKEAEVPAVPPDPPSPPSSPELPEAVEPESPPAPEEPDVPPAPPPADNLLQDIHPVPAAPPDPLPLPPLPEPPPVDPLRISDITPPVFEHPPVSSLPEHLVLPPPVEPEKLSLPPPPALDQLPLPPPPQPPLATTDLQGNWGSPATLSPPVPPAALPMPAAEEEEQPETVTEDDEEKTVQTAQRDTRRLKRFGILTLSLIVATLIAGIFFLQPHVQDILESKRSEDARIFEDVLVNMLQIDNQHLEVEITDSQLEQIQPALEGQEEIESGKIVVNNVMKVDYAPDFSRPGVVSKFRFDLDLQTTERDNFILDVVTVFNGQGVYFMIEGLSINNQPQDLSQTEFARRWSDLEALSQVQSASEDAPLSENQSVFLNYVANLLKLYSHPHYLFLLPVFNITQGREYNQVREILLASQAYYLHTGSCEPAQSGQRSCHLTIDYKQLYQLYADIYEVLDTELPAYYDILLTADQNNSNLPKTVILTFDAERNYPILLEAPVNEGEISASRLEISYKEFDASKLDVPVVSDPLDLAEYHRQILEYEAQQLR